MKTVSTDNPTRSHTHTQWEVPSKRTPFIKCIFVCVYCVGHAATEGRVLFEFEVDGEYHFYACDSHWEDLCRCGKLAR